MATVQFIYEMQVDTGSRPYGDALADVLHHDARRARFRGQAKVGFQARMCAAVYNLKRWVALQREQQQNKPPKKRR